jgi:parvulin-like peptidyl-prolyl isomerase
MRHSIYLLTILLACAPAQAAFDTVNGIAAIANGTVITFQDVDMASAQSIEVARRTSATPETFYQKKIEAKRDAIDLLVERQLILSDFKTVGVNVPESYIDDVVNDRIRQRFGDRANLTKTLMAEGITSETFRQRMREEIILDYMQSKNVREASLISPAKIENYYQTNLVKYQLGDRVKLRVIVVKDGLADNVRELAQEILTKINAGAPFADMATVYSTESRGKDGGLWGWYEESQLNKGLADIAFGLRSNQVSSVIGLARAADDTYWVYQYDKSGKVTMARHFPDRGPLIAEKKYENGGDPREVPVLPQQFYLIKAEDRQVAHTRSLEAVRDEIEKELIVEERKRLKKKWIERLRAKSFVRYFY